MKKYSRIDLIMNWQLELNWEIARGLRDAVASRAYAWEFFSNDRNCFSSALSWKTDGIIVSGLVEPDLIALAQEVPSLPIINLSPYPKTPGITQVDGDLYAAGSLAADHFFSLGFTEAVWLGSQNEPANGRGHGFEERMLELGGSAASLLDISGVFGREHPRVMKNLSRAIERLEKPAAIFCVNDDLGRIVLSVCRDQELPVPEEVAVLGTQNSPFICEGLHPYLSSVEVGYREIGRIAADLLHRKIAGETVPDCTLISPINVVQRASTDVLALSDERLRKGITFLRTHYMEKVDLSKLAASVGLSRRGLEYLFRNVLQRSPHEEMMRLRFERAKLLLRTTQMSIDDVAFESGFNSGHYLCDIFKRHVGETPSAYRKNHLYG